MPASDQPESAIRGDEWFATTHWSAIFSAAETSMPGAADALEELCSTYWPALYAYARRRGHTPEEAQDLTQQFFVRFLEKKYVKLADRERGKFRAFLLTSFKHFLVNEWDSARSAKRGGDQVVLSLDHSTAEGRYLAEPAADLTPDKVFDKRWAITILEEVLARLCEESIAAGNAEQFDQFKDFLWGEKNTVSQAEIATQLGLTASAVKSALHRLRLRYRDLLRAEVARTVAFGEDIDEELRYLISVVAQ